MRKKGLILSVLLILLLTACSNEKTSEAEETAVSENQRIAYAVINEINGNEINIDWAEEKVITMQNGRMNEDGGASGERTADEGRGEHMMSDMSSESSGKAGMEAQKMDGGQTPETAAESESSAEEKENGSVGMEAVEITTYESTGETAVLMIPVGTAVYTSEEKLTTFSRLQAGDTIELLLETVSSDEEVIIQVKIVE